ncbi:hypothetical protein DNHGIG_13410 [Collibacillus ludicampi]|uniref:Actin-like protein N-terminal domain-containing protein n=1 Tax=Collibacillus ludicampi TaxID=2771369 RepID=A0AAV4LEC1_9BACL|nr:ParM/StbA family protein [Collibacillus ludicampi]GIM45792.1 hypothetical protein DNHGIG_13410 [Collibacillus ludicampi]
MAKRPIYVGLDAGYGYTKVSSSVKKPQAFPSVAEKAPKDTLKGMQSLFSKIKTANVDVLDSLHVSISENALPSVEWVVGSKALRSGLSRVDYVLTENKVDDPKFRALLATALAIATPDVSGEYEVNLCTGLAVSYFAEQQGPLTESLQNRVFEVAYHEGPYKGVEKRIRIKNVLVAPQGLGVVLGMLLEQGKSMDDVENGLVAILDIGMKTTDYAVFEGYEPVPAMSDGITDLGMNRITQAIRNTNRKLTNAQADELAWTGKTTGMRADEELMSELESLKQDLATAIANEVFVQAWNENLSQFDKVYITGGGGEVLFPYLKAYGPNIELTNKKVHARFGNSQGFLNIARYIFGEEADEAAAGKTEA